MGSEPRPVKITVLQAPQYKPIADSPGDARYKTGGGRTIFLIGAGAEDFVQRTQRQPAARQGTIDSIDPKGQYAMMQRIGPLDTANALLQGGEAGNG
jgi:hypothetical protein